MARFQKRPSMPRYRSRSWQRPPPRFPGSPCCHQGSRLSRAHKLCRPRRSVPRGLEHTQACLSFFSCSAQYESEWLPHHFVSEASLGQQPRMALHIYKKPRAPEKNVTERCCRGASRLRVPHRPHRRRARRGTRDDPMINASGSCWDVRPSG